MRARAVRCHRRVGAQRAPQIARVTHRADTRPRLLRDRQQLLVGVNQRSRHAGERDKQGAVALIGPRHPAVEIKLVLGAGPNQPLDQLRHAGLMPPQRCGQGVNAAVEIDFHQQVIGTRITGRNDRNAQKMHRRNGVKRGARQRPHIRFERGPFARADSEQQGRTALLSWPAATSAHSVIHRCSSAGQR